jgi:dTDP-4-amino-4,6-dideoxygalactose transaminase
MSSKPNLAVATQRIEFIDLAAQQTRIKAKLDTAIAKVLAHGTYIMGPEVTELEKQLSAFCGAKYTLSCSNGTDALALVLMAKRVRPGDAIFCPSFTFAATAEVVAWLGAKPMFVDIDPVTFNMCAKSFEQAIAEAKKLGLKLTGVMPVDLFGQPANYDVINPIAEAHGMWVLCDAAQGFGGNYKGRKVGTIGMATATSFFPAKPLGCYGDGGAIFTDDEELYKVMESLRVHGKGEDKYDNVRIGMNGRLDTLQAAILIEKLAIFADEINERQRVANRYSAALRDVITTPTVMEGCVSAWAQYTLIAKSADERAMLQNGLKAAGIPTAVYYPKPLHQQTAYKHFPTATGGALPVSEDLGPRVFSLPMHPYLADETIDFIAATLRGLLA